MEYGFDIGFSKEDILGIAYELSKDKLDNQDYMEAIYDFEAVLLSYFEENKQ